MFQRHVDLSLINRNICLLKVTSTDMCDNFSLEIALYNILLQDMVSACVQTYFVLVNMWRIS